MSCEEANEAVKQAWADWQIAMDAYTSLVNLGGVTVVDEEGSAAIQAASERFAEADTRFLLAVQAHLRAAEAHRPIRPSN